MVDLKTEGEITIWRDPERNLPETDPFDRQLTIGMGCFLEQLAIAASATGHKVDYSLFPDGGDGPVAVARFAEGAATDPLFAHVMDRRSCKEPYEARAVPAALANELAALADIHTAPDKVAALRALAWDALEIEFHTTRTMKESIDLIRVGKREIEANPDGIDLGGAFFESVNALGLMNREDMLNPNSMAFQQNVEAYSGIVAATPAFAAIRTAGNTRLDQIEAGRRWLRLNLTTTRMGLALHPVSQALQEFPEMSEIYAKAHEMLAGEGETVQMLGRLGYGPETPPSPRWPLETRIAHG